MTDFDRASHDRYVKITAEAEGGSVSRAPGDEGCDVVEEHLSENEAPRSLTGDDAIHLPIQQRPFPPVGGDVIARGMYLDSWVADDGIERCPVCKRSINRD